MPSDQGHRTRCPIIVCAEGGDHLYETCPHLRREVGHRGTTAISCTCSGTCDPLDATVCGWCRRVWAARHWKVAVTVQ
jgi:hypothetical protein